MKTFNSIQAVVLFALWPFLLGWLNTATFTGATVALWICGIAYVVGFVMMIISVRIAIGELG